MQPAADPLQRYRERRNFSQTPEPAPGAAPAQPGTVLSFVVQQHHARRLHHDFRLELGGVLLSWAVPKGPSLDPADKRMAVRTEDHPLDYGSFEGTIPPGQYGAGEVIVWDRGTWQPQGDPQAALAQGKLAFTLHGHKLQGLWELVRMKPRAGDRAALRQEAWLLFKKRDAHARAAADFDVLSARPGSVLDRALPAAVAPEAHAVATSAADTRSAPRAARPPRAPAGAVPAPLPETLSPQLATLATAVPQQGRWIFEQKFDGYRLLTRIEGGVPRLITRGGHDWTARMPALAAELAALGADCAWLDGEIVVAGSSPQPHGRHDFNALQNAFESLRAQDAPGRRAAARGTGHAPPAIEYHLFDLPYFEGHDLRDAPLSARRGLLRQWLLTAPQPHLHFSEALGQGTAQSAAALLQRACSAHGEGLIAKRDDAPYRGTRSTDWLKLKCQLRQEFVIAGYAPRRDDALAVGSLLLAVHDAQGRLQSAGHVGTGWSRATARALLQRLQALHTAQPPFDAPAPAGGTRWPGRQAAGTHWVRPELLAEVSFSAWTPAAQVRHAVFLGLREDKPAREITRETPVQAEAIEAAAAPALKLTHPERVVDAASGLTKRDLVHYYERVADALLPHLQGRPVALLRAPRGVGQPTFFQRHSGGPPMPGMVLLDPALWPGHAPLMEIATREALLGAAQMNVIEFHPWNAGIRKITQPDRMIFDLDPGEGVAWPAVREGALLVRTLLSELGLQSWLKTSGGKGLHVVVPLAPRLGFDTVKAFAKAIVQHLAATIPSRFVVKSGPANRQGRIFVDYLRNGEGATTVAAFSARARPGLGVSMTLDWDELSEVTSSDQWTVASAPDHLAMRGDDPWAGLARTRQSLTGAMKALGFKAPAAPGGRAARQDATA